MNAILSTLLTSAGLGLGAGINAYATLLVFGGLGRLYPNLFDGEMARFFSSTPVLITMAILYTIEFVADKVPAVDHVWDVIHTFIRPLAGGLVAFASVTDTIPKPIVILATVVGGGAALGAHTTKAALRAMSSITTAGTANPVLSILEDLFVFVNSFIAIFLPLLVLASIALVVVVSVLLFRRFRAAT